MSVELHYYSLDYILRADLYIHLLNIKMIFFSESLVIYP